MLNKQAQKFPNKEYTLSAISQKIKELEKCLSASNKKIIDIKDSFKKYLKEKMIDETEKEVVADAFENFINDYDTEQNKKIEAFEKQLQSYEKTMNTMFKEIELILKMHQDINFN